MTDAVRFADIFRGDILESIHFGHAMVVNSAGEIVEGWGDAGKVILPRSSAKMIQALPLLESGAGKNLSSERLALACASHRGERIHVERINAWLSELGLTRDDLKCGPQTSRDEALAAEMIRSDTAVTREFNNCSGKHTGFLMLSQHLNADLEYVDPEHPVQRSVKEAFEGVTDETSPGYGIDGCSAPNFACTMKGLAYAMAGYASADGKSGVRAKAQVALRDAMIAHPELVAGSGSACTELMEAASEPFAVKTGAEGVYIAILPKQQLGVALKIQDGATRAAEIAIAAILVRLGVLDPEHPVVARYLNRPILNWDGLVTGSEKPSAILLAH